MKHESKEGIERQQRFGLPAFSPTKVKVVKLTTFTFAIYKEESREDGGVFALRPSAVARRFGRQYWKWIFPRWAGLLLH